MRDETDRDDREEEEIESRRQDMNFADQDVEKRGSYSEAVCTIGL